MQINTYPLVRGLASYVLPAKLFKMPGSGGSFSSKYCYSVWLRHITYLEKNKLINDITELKNVAEIGPGDSLGIGLSALYTGAQNYYAFDVIEHAKVNANLQINRDLKTYFSEKMDVPNGVGFQNTNPVLTDYTFPKSILTYGERFYDERATEIEKALTGAASKVSIKYVVPWTTATHAAISNIDLIFSQAVMEHVSDLHFAYSEMFKWLKPGGIASHQVDFKTHEMTAEWNGHWFISQNWWNLLAHGRKYPMNRLPLSSHIKALEAVGFVIKSIVPVLKENRFKESPKLKGVEFSADDLITASALIQAIKP